MQKNAVFNLDWQFWWGWWWSVSILKTELDSHF